MGRKPKTLPGKVFAHLGSFWLAIALLVNLFLLTWLGTLEQVDKGIHAIQHEYFESLFVVSWAFPVPLPLPGGYVTMGLLTLNLVVGGLVRIRKSRATAGIIVAHVGIALMMAGGLVEHMTSKYGNIKLYEGETGDWYQEYAGWEVAIWDASQTSGIQEYLIPDEHFVDLGGERTRKFTRDELPFDLVLGRYMKHSFPMRVRGGVRPDAPVVENWFLRPEPPRKEEEQNLAGLYATVIQADGAQVDKSFLWGFAQRPWVVRAGGKDWAIALRHTRHTMPYALRLEKFIKDDHPGLTMARAFSSDIVRIEKDGSEHPQRIQMNEPLREGGLIIYQASYGPQNGEPGDPYSVLAVSVNPSDRIPWISVSIISIGLLWTFLARLIGFLGKEKRRAARAADVPETPEPRAAA